MALAQEEQDAAAARGKETPLFGAKITGGGGGGEWGLPLLLCYAGQLCRLVSSSALAEFSLRRQLVLQRCLWPAMSTTMTQETCFLQARSASWRLRARQAMQPCSEWCRYAAVLGCRGIHACARAAISCRGTLSVARTRAFRWQICCRQAFATAQQRPAPRVPSLCPSASCSDTQQRPAAGRTCSRARLAVQWHLAACACGGEALLQLRRQRTADPNLTCRCNNALQMNYCNLMQREMNRETPSCPNQLLHVLNLLQCSSTANCLCMLSVVVPSAIAAAQLAAHIAIAAASRLPARRRLSRRDTPCRVGSSPSPAAPAPAPPACGGQGAPVGRSAAGGQAMWAAGWQCCPALRLHGAAAGRCLPCQAGCWLGGAGRAISAGWLTLRSPTASTRASSCAPPAGAPRPRACTSAG